MLHVGADAVRFVAEGDLSEGLVEGRHRRARVRRAAVSCQLARVLELTAAVPHAPLVLAELLEQQFGLRTPPPGT